MSLLSDLASTAREILSNTADFAVAMKLTSPEGRTVTIAGLQADIGLSIDPETGVAIAGRKASVAISSALLAELGVELPQNIPEDDRRPWLVEWTPPTGGAQKMKVVSTIPDKLGIVVLHLERYVS